MNKNRLKACFRVGQMVGCGLLALGLVACGDNKGSSGGVTLPESDNLVWRQGEFKDSTLFKVRCPAPRSGINPETGKPFEDQAGSEGHEKFWMRSMTYEAYLWADEVEDKDPAYFTPEDYFKQLKTNALTPAKASKDRYHWREKTEYFYQRFVQGEAYGFGIEWEFNWDTDVHTVRYVQPSSPAGMIGVERGMVLEKIGGRALAELTDWAVYDAISPPGPVATIFTMKGGRVFNLVSSLVAETLVFPVKYFQVQSVPAKKVAYVQVNGFGGPAELGLMNTFKELQRTNIDELVIDLRYNGGGYLRVASQLAFMVAGADVTADKAFSLNRYSPRFLLRNPSAAKPQGFESTTLGISEDAPLNVPLPSLNLKRLYVLTGAGTCSASESLINGLRGVDFPVIQIGTPTCGKPYGFRAPENCGYTYFSINFQGQNAKGFGDYADGMSPLDPIVNQGSPEGCVVQDDFTHLLGDSSEKRLAAALQHIASGRCDTTALGVVESMVEQGAFLRKAPLGVGAPLWRSNMIQ